MARNFHQPEMVDHALYWLEDSAILHHMHQSAIATYQQDISSYLDEPAAFFDWTCLGIHTGSRLGEYGQSTLSGSHPFQFVTVLDSHDAGIWRKSPLAFMGSDFTFFDVNGVQLAGPSQITLYPTNRAAAVHMHF
jgi:hypothetical protein